MSGIQCPTSRRECFGFVTWWLDCRTHQKTARTCPARAVLESGALLGLDAVRMALRYEDARARVSAKAREVQGGESQEPVDLDALSWLDDTVKMIEERRAAARQVFGGSRTREEARAVLDEIRAKKAATERLRDGMLSSPHDQAKAMETPLDSIETA